MCDCYYHKCEECSRSFPLHIGGFYVARSTIEVRCEKHSPEKGQGWWKFTNCHWEEEKYGDMYMRYVGTEEMLHRYGNFYGIGEEGDIVPNCSYDGEEVY